MPNNDSHHHVVKTSAQWDERAIEFWVVPRGCLCVELTPEGITKIKIGEGNKFYSQLPYVNDMSNLENYYTKEEVDNIVKNINLMAIRSTDEYDSRNDLPVTGNKLGDVRFVKSSSPSIKIDPDVYLWNGSRWIYVGYELQDIDLSQYLKKEEFHTLFDPVRAKVEEMYPKMHTHENKAVLDRIQEPYTTAEKEKLVGLENYDDTEIRELIQETGHTHPNKQLLDTITSDSLWSGSDREKFDTLRNYDIDITNINNDIDALESVAHTHTNKNILDQVTAAFTIEDKTKLDSLHNNDVFIGTDGMYGGREGLVPAPTIMDAGKFLCADGTWRPAAGDVYVDFVGATASEDGVHGLVPAPLIGDQNKFLRGDGTWQSVGGGTDYSAGDGIIFNNPSETYIFVEYIHLLTNTSISTGIIPSGINDFSAEIKYSITSTSQEGKLLIAYNDQAGSISYNPSSSGRSRIWIYRAQATWIDVWGTSLTPNTIYTTACTWGRNMSLQHLPDGTIYTNTTSIDPTNVCTMYIGDNNREAYVYYLKLWDGNTLVGDFVPCVRQSDNRAGVFNRLTNIFYTNPSGPALTYGPPTGDTYTVSFPTTIAAKIGDGLIFDTNRSIAVTPATTENIGGVKVGAGLSMNANDELGVTSPYVTSVANQGSVPGVVTVSKSDGTSSDVDVLYDMRFIFNCNFDSSMNQDSLGRPVNAPVSGHEVGSPIIGDLTIIEVNE